MYFAKLFSAWDKNITIKSFQQKHIADTLSIANTDVDT